MNKLTERELLAMMLKVVRQTAAELVLLAYRLRTKNRSDDTLQRRG